MKPLNSMPVTPEARRRLKHMFQSYLETKLFLPCSPVPLKNHQFVFLQLGKFNSILLKFFKNSGKTVLIMDEVDGMSGSDRGGIAKLIQLLKKTKIPIICICNDRQSSKVRSLRNYCLELQFRKFVFLFVKFSRTKIYISKNQTNSSASDTKIVGNCKIREING